MRTLLGILILGITSSITAQSILLDEDFEQGIPSAWTLVNKDGLTPDESVAEYTEAWITVADPLTDSVNRCASSTSFFTSAGKANRWLITPAITLEDEGNLLEFRAASFDPSFPDTYTIKIGEDLNKLDEFETVLTFISESPSWKKHSVFLDTLGHSGKTVYIAFVLTTDNGHKLFLDDIQVKTKQHLSVTEAEKLKITMYPNPTIDYLTITGAEGIRKEVYGITGARVLSTYDDVMDVQHLYPGVYILKFENSNQFVKFIKE